MDSIITWFYYIFAVIYTFKFWGFWYGILGFFLPIFPLIDGAKLLIESMS